MSTLPQVFYQKPTEQVARELLGKVLVRRFKRNVSSRSEQSGIEGTKEAYNSNQTGVKQVDLPGTVTEIRLLITETEAYLGPHDQACHTRRGPTPRTQVMFGSAGFWYIYLIYGMYHCLNVVTEKVGSGSAVLIRGGQLLTPLDPEENNREIKTDGPGKLCRALEIDRSFNKTSAFNPTSQLFIEDALLNNPFLKNFEVEKLPRVGVQYAGEKWDKALLRFRLITDHA